MSSPIRYGIAAKFRPWTTAENQMVRDLYTELGPDELARRLNRTTTAVEKKAGSLGVKRRRRWTPQDDRQLRELWGTASTETVARAMRRTPATTYWRARKLGLATGATFGREYLSAAAERAGFATASLKRVMRYADQPLHRTASRPTGARRHYHAVEPADVDDAVQAWLESEDVYPAAKRHGICGETLQRWLREARASGFDVPPEPKRHKHRWRVPSATIDAVVQWRRGFESLRKASARTGVSIHRLRSALRRAGVPRSATKVWLLERETVDRVVAWLSEAGDVNHLSSVPQ